MKIKRVHFKEAIVSIHNLSADNTRNKLEYLPEGFIRIDDKVLVPFSNIKEILLEDEEPKIEEPKVTKKVK